MYTPKMMKGILSNCPHIEQHALLESLLILLDELDQETRQEDPDQPTPNSSPGRRTPISRR